MIVVCGEALVDLVPAPPAGGRAYVARPGGGPFNTAVALGRLEVPAAFLGCISRDRLGGTLHAELRDSGVDLRLARRVDHPTPLAVVDLSETGEATYGLYLAGTAAATLGPDGATALPDLPGEATAVHVASLALVVEPPASALERLLASQRGGRLVSLDPNVRPTAIADRVRYLERLARWVAAADVVRLSVPDLAWLWPGETAEAVAARLLDGGPALVVVTLGADGALALNRSGQVREPVVAGEVVDTIGAGDAFNAGLLAWLYREGAADRGSLDALEPAGLRAALRFAGLVSALTCARPGADPPRMAELAGARARQV